MTQDERNELIQAIVYALNHETSICHEARTSATVKVLVGGFEWLYTVRGSSPTDLMNALPGLSTALEGLGCTPAAPRFGGGGQAPKQQNGTVNINDELVKPPLCPDHGTPMRLMTFQGHRKWKCTQILGDKHDEMGQVEIHPPGHKFAGQPVKLFCKRSFEVGEV